MKKTRKIISSTIFNASELDYSGGVIAVKDHNVRFDVWFKEHADIAVKSKLYVLKRVRIIVTIMIMDLSKKIHIECVFLSKEEKYFFQLKNNYSCSFYVV